MSDNTVGKRTGLGRITGAATVIAVLLAVLGSLVLGGSAGVQAGPSGSRVASDPLPATLPNTAIDLNRSQSAGAYVPEYVTLNNSTSLTRLPASLTVTASTCKWVTVENLTSAAIPTSAFHNVEYANESSSNASGTLLSHASAFRVCGGSGVWINFVYWTFSIYQFASSGLEVNATVTLGGFSDWAGTTTAPANVSATVGPDALARFVIASNLTFIAVLPATVDGPNSCDATGQVCSFTQYSFVSAADASNVTRAHTIAFTRASGLLVTASYENWTVGYVAATVSDNTAIGGFFAGTSSFFQEVFVQFWYLWILALLVLALVFAVARRGRR
jgi:hypothetical protein